MIYSANKFRILSYVLATICCCNIYSVDFALYYRFNLIDNVYNYDFSCLDPENQIIDPDWINISGVYHNRTFTATETDDFKQHGDHYQNGILAFDYLLIHGINSHPTSEDDSKTAFADLKDKLSLVPEIDPAWVFDFPWTAKYGVYTNYCGKVEKAGSLYKYLDEKCKPFDEKPVIIAHSMGGLLLLKQVELDLSL